jgi:DNA invertase Pin-like site-specific DNA recombinase
MTIQLHPFCTLGGRDLRRREAIRRSRHEPPSGARKEGETIVVWRSDRLGRSIINAVDTVAMLGEGGISLCAVQDGIDPSTPNGRLMLNLLASLAEYERHLISERIAAGMTAARQTGTQLGRPPADPDAAHEKLRIVEQARARGLTAAHAAQLVGWSRATLYRHQHQHGSQP